MSKVGKLALTVVIIGGNNKTLNELASVLVWLVDWEEYQATVMDMVALL